MAAFWASAAWATETVCPQYLRTAAEPPPRKPQVCCRWQLCRRVFGDQLGHAYAEIIVEHEHFAPSDQSAVGVNIDRVTGQVGSEGVLPGWRGVPVAAAMEEVLSTKVLLENTANLAALGEAKFGALQGVSNGVFIKASYGVGAGLIIGGELFRGSAGTAASHAQQ